MLISKLLDDHREALKKEGKIVDLHQRMEELSTVGKAATEKISQLKSDLDSEAVVQRSQEKELK